MRQCLRLPSSARGSPSGGAAVLDPPGDGRLHSAPDLLDGRRMLGAQAQWLPQFQETMVWFSMDRTIETAIGLHFSLEERIQS
jgi:hypothetical protein